MNRSVNISLKFLTERKKFQISALIFEYRRVVNFYIKSLWELPGKLDAETLARLPNDRTKLTSRYKSQALRQALSVVISTKKSLKEIQKNKKIKEAECPVFKGHPILDAKFVSVSSKRTKEFDLIILLSSLKRGKRIALTCKKTSPFNKWENWQGSRLIDGFTLFKDHIQLSFELPENRNENQKVIGLDIGVHKLLVDSDRNFYGTKFKEIRDKILRKTPGSAGAQKARNERKQYIDSVVKKLPWHTIKCLGIENLKGLKTGKSKKRGKNFRRAMAPWTYRYVIKRIEEIAQENGVHLVRVSPDFTSQTCPKCNMVSRSNRKGEKFLCVSCGYREDADFVGAQNVLARTFQFLGSLESPNVQKV